jgi:hypothetical protein
LFVIHLAGGEWIVGCFRVARVWLRTPKPAGPSSSLRFFLVLFIPSPLLGKLFASSLTGDGTVESNVIVFQLFFEFIEPCCILKPSGEGIMTSAELKNPDQQ